MHDVDFSILNNNLAIKSLYASIEKIWGDLYGSDQSRKSTPGKQPHVQ